MGVNGETDDTSSSIDKCGKRFVKPPMFQKGVLRTNCIDCLDRTNVAQFAFGLVSLGHQLHALGFTDDPIIGMDCPLADDIMRLYETMGDTLALQYGGSAAHNKSKIKLPVNSGKKKSGLSAEKPFLLAYEEAYC